MTLKFFFDAPKINISEFEKKSVDLQTIYNHNSYLNFLVNRPNSLLNDLDLKIFDLTSNDSIRNLLTYSFSSIDMFKSLFFSSTQNYSDSQFLIMNNYWKFLTLFYNINSITGNGFLNVYYSFLKFQHVSNTLRNQIKRKSFKIENSTNPFLLNVFPSVFFDKSEYVNIVANSSFLFNLNTLYLNVAGSFLNNYLFKYSNISFFKPYINPFIYSFIDHSMTTKRTMFQYNKEQNDFDFSNDHFVFNNYYSFDFIKKKPWRWIKLRLKSDLKQKKKSSFLNKLLAYNVKLNTKETMRIRKQLYPEYFKNIPKKKKKN
ncbi:MAG: hypothetical protein ACXW07_06750 [Nitrososphaeraceae archaeon]